MLRAWLVEPMHDEVATLFHYIETGRIFQRNMIHDANNHLLNSWIGHFLFKMGITHFFWYRLANVLAYLPFIFSIRFLFSKIEISWIKIIGWLSCGSSIFILDYFSFCRGYGLGLGFFACMLVYAHKWVQYQQIKHAFYLLVFAFFSLLANLVFMTTTFLAFGLVLWVVFSFSKRWVKKQKLQIGLLLLIFTLMICPLIYYSFFLRQIGALYYGSLTGMWEVTGKSLLKVTIFYNDNWLMWLLLIFILTLIGDLILNSFKSGIKYWKNEPLAVVTYFLLGNLLAIFLLAQLFHVNYPEDRAGIYFIPLFILAFVLFLNKWRVFHFLLVFLLFFPVVLMSKANFNTSVFYSEMRMSPEWYKQVRPAIHSNNTVSIYKTMELTWNYAERQQNHPVIPQPTGEISSYFDFILTRGTFYFPNKVDTTLYELFAYDPVTSYMAYRRRVPLRKKLIERVSLQEYTGNASEIILMDRRIRTEEYGKTFCLSIKAKGSKQFAESDYQIGFETADSNGNSIRSCQLEQRWSRKPHTQNYDIFVNYIFVELQPCEAKMRVYLLNPQGNLIGFIPNSFEITQIIP